MSNVTKILEPLISKNVQKNGRFANIQCVSKLFQPINVIPKDAAVKKHDITSKSQKLMLDLGIIRQANPGCFHFLPLGLRALEKLTNLVDRKMKEIGGQKVIFPTLTQSELWQKSGRLETVSSELFRIKDRHDHDYIMSPTHEEAASDLLASLSPLSYKHFPLRLYQITSKYRDEIKPRFGLMRARQFIMKDLYAFDINVEDALETYETICDSYNEIFAEIGVDFVKVVGCSGHMGGNHSHEYHYKSPIGEDRILTCKRCNYAGNVEVCGQASCPNCRNVDVEITHGIEIGHTFFLGDKYSKPLNALSLSKSGKPDVLQMGSYGLGISRILAATLELLSKDNEIKWPNILAPYKIALIPPKEGSKEQSAADGLMDGLLKKLEHWKDDVIIDDRTALTIGRRFLEAKKTGYPLIIVLGQKITDNPPVIELNDLANNQQSFLQIDDLFECVKQRLD